MKTVKKAKLGLMSKPSPVADLRSSKIYMSNSSFFKTRKPKFNTVTIEKNGDFKELPF